MKNCSKCGRWTSMKKILAKIMRKYGNELYVLFPTVLIHEEAISVIWLNKEMIIERNCEYNEDM